jgi:CRISPR/Cas system-associated exonuclease Cas4 (RecB family)
MLNRTGNTQAIMGEATSTDSRLDLSKPMVQGKMREDGHWIDVEGVVLPVSASDLERHTYCPVSWQLSKAGVSGEGEAIKRGMQAHDQIHNKMNRYKQAEDRASRELVVWSWWFTVVCALSADSAAFFFVNQGTISEDFIQNMGQYLVILAGVWLLLAIMLISLPWRRWLGWPFGLAQPPVIESGLDEEAMESPFTTDASGVGIAGKTEVRLLFASIAVALHGLAIYWAENRTTLAFALIIFTLIWLLVTAWKLHTVLLTEKKANLAKQETGLGKEEILAYSDDAGESASLLIDEDTGVRGRPDQIVKIDNQFIPVEQKTGKIPHTPHHSHKMQLMAYLHLVENTTNVKPDYGILRYGTDTLFTVQWDLVAKQELIDSIKEIQRLMVQGGAKRNHERKGKCMNCSRRSHCPQSLI